MAIRLRFHNHAPQQLPTCLTLDQQAANQLRGDLFCGGAKKEWGRAVGAWKGVVAMGVVAWEMGRLIIKERKVLT